MKERFKFLATLIVLLFVGIALISGFFTLIFRDVRTGSMRDYLTGHLFHRFAEFFMIFAPAALAVSIGAVAVWLLCELLHERKP